VASAVSEPPRTRTPCLGEQDGCLVQLIELAVRKSLLDLKNRNGDVLTHGACCISGDRLTVSMSSENLP